MNLTATAQLRRIELETIVDAGIDTCFAVGRALAELRDKKLYLDTHATFKDYCRDRWGMSDEYARLQMRAAVVVDNIANTPTIVGPLPTNESQVRPLAKLPPGEQPAAWLESVEEAGGTPTAKHVAAVVARRTSTDDRTPARRTLSKGAEESLRIKGLFKSRLAAVLKRGPLTHDELRIAIGPPKASAAEANQFLSMCAVSGMVEVRTLANPKRYEFATIPVANAVEIDKLAVEIGMDLSANARIQRNAEHIAAMLPPAGKEWEPAKQTFAVTWNLAEAVKGLRSAVAKFTKDCPGERWPEVAEVLRDLADQLDNGSFATGDAPGSGADHDDDDHAEHDAP